MREINAKLDALRKPQHFNADRKSSYSDLPLDVETLLSIPDHLRKSTLVVSELEEATAFEVAAKTGRTRAAESDYLNQLVTLGLLKKRRKGRDVYFSPGE